MIDLDFLRTVKAVILDMDGVLVETESVHMNAFYEFLKRYGIEADDAFLRSFIGYSVEENFIMLRDKFDTFKTEPLQNYIDERNKLYIELLKADQLEPMPGIIDLLDICINNNIKLALASSSDKIQIDTILNNLNANPDFELNLYNVFAAIISGDSVSAKKPAPDIYLRALKELNLPAAHTIAVEDSPAGVSSAINSGIFCIALKSPYLPAADIKGQDISIDSIYELVEALFEAFV
jgi:beta-phosphoglucomutase-like phosphatase (HAD superfamily)